VTLLVYRSSLVAGTVYRASTTPFNVEVMLIKVSSKRYPLISSKEHW